MAGGNFDYMCRYANEVGEMGVIVRHRLPPGLYLKWEIDPGRGHQWTVIILLEDDYSSTVIPRVNGLVVVDSFLDVVQWIPDKCIFQN